MYFMPQSGAGISRSGGRCANAALVRAATVSGVSGAGSPMLMTPKITVLSPRPSKVFVAGDIGVAEVEVQCRRPGDAGECAVDRRSRAQPAGLQ
jgi:hypothetical protein